MHRDVQSSSSPSKKWGGATSTSHLSERHRWGRIGHWNLGGQKVGLLDVAAADTDLLFLQEVARDHPGWDQVETEHFHWITHRSPEQWRGVAIGFALDKFDCALKKVATKRGIWVLARIKNLGRIVCGSLHAHTGVTNAVYQGAVDEFFGALPRSWRQYPLLCGIDANETCQWIRDEVDNVALGQCSSNLNALLQNALQHGCQPCAPRWEQRHAPTHFPRDSTRQGRQIDLLISRQIGHGPVVIDAERRHCVGSDHAYLFLDVFLRSRPAPARWGNESRARWVTGELPATTIIDDSDITALARSCTKPRCSAAFRDSEEIKQAIAAARTSGTPGEWKRVHRLRHACRKHWKNARLSKVLHGSWEDFRHLQAEKKRKRGWWGQMLEHRSSKELTREVQAHLQNKMVDPKMENWDTDLSFLIASIDKKGDFVPFTLVQVRGELQGMRCRSAVGPDLIGVSLLRSIVSHDVLGPQLLDLVNHIVDTQEIPAVWERSFLALLTKVDVPSKASDLRPISVSSAFNKLVNRLVCSRALPLLRRGSKISACGRGRQAADLIGATSRLRDVIREWKLPAILCKLDVAGAFDRVDRRRVADLLIKRLRDHDLGSELRYLLCQLRCHTLEGRVPGGDVIEIQPNNGIKQGAPESAEIFGLVVDALLSEVVGSPRWAALGESLPGLAIETMFYQDDIFVIDHDLGVLGRRVRIIDKCLQQAGLRLATAKTKIIASPEYAGSRHISIGEDEFVIADARESLKVLGMNFSFCESPSQQAQELLCRTRSAAASHRDILTAKGSWSKKMHMMKTLVESQFSWTGGAVHWSQEDLREANLLQLHSVRTAFGLKRLAGENWVDWNSRTIRFCRVWLHSQGHPRWSEKILSLQHNLHGHWARRSEVFADGQAVESLPLRALKWRCTHWWRMQQSLPSSIGLRHPCRFYASNPERQLSDLVIVMAVIGLCLRLIGQGGPQLVSPTLLRGTFVGALDVNFRSDTSWLFFPYDEVTVEHCD